MAINRRFLYAGLFLVAIGGVVAAADLGDVRRGLILEALRLWPLVLIALGLGIVVRRTPVGLPAGVLAAVAPGLLIGGGFALGPPVAGECGTSEAPVPVLLFEDTAPARPMISLDTGCGSSTITTALGNTWRVSAARSDGRAPDIGASEDGLSVTSPGRGGRQLFFGTSREVWDVVLPTSPVELLSISANANEMTVRLPGADLGTLAVTANASNVRLDAGGATLDDLQLDVNFSTASLTLPAYSATGSINVNAGSLRLCHPSSNGLHVYFVGDGPREITVDGVPYHLQEWRNDAGLLSSHQIELTVDVDFGSVDINPKEGCA